MDGWAGWGEGVVGGCGGNGVRALPGRRRSAGSGLDWGDERGGWRSKPPNHPP